MSSTIAEDIITLLVQLLATFGSASA